MRSKKLMILVADYDLSMLRAVSQVVAVEGHPVMIATNAPTVLLLTEAKSPTHAILEIATRGDGLEVGRLLHKFSSIPAIMLRAEMLEW